MADDTAPAPIDAEALQRAIAALQPPTQAPVPTEGGPATHGVGGFLADVGTALSGGQTGLLGLSPDEQASAGRHALLRFGIDMLAASGKSYAPKDFGTVLAAGLGGAQQAQQESENRAYYGRGAAQQLAQQAFQNRIAAAKEALPLLIAGQNAQIPNPLVGGGGKPNTSISTAAAVPAYGGAANAPQMPAEYEPYFQEASKATGIPVEVLKAQAAQESGFNPDAKGAAGEVGLFQIKPDTARKPGFGMQGVSDPAVLRDPRTNIMFGAQYLKARAGNADLSTPAGQAAALQAYNGGGDKNYVANVFRYMPKGGTQVAAATPPPAAPAAATPPGRVQVATADTGTKTDATPAPVASTPVGDLGLVKDPVTGNVSTPNAGGLGTGAAAPAAPAAPGLPSFEQWQTQHPRTVNPDLYNVPAPDLAALKSAQDTAAQQLSLARAGRGGDVNKSLSDYNTAAKAVTDAQAAATKASAELRQKAQADLDNNDRQLYDAEMQRQQTAAENDKNRQNQIDLKNVEAEQARKTASAASENSFVLDTRKKLTDERSAAQETVDNLGLLDNLSKAAGTATPLDSLSWGGMPLRQWLLQKNLGSPEQIARWGAQQAYEAAINQTVIGLRKGVSMGALSDRDLSFLQGMSPSVLQRPDTREAVTAYLRSAQLRKIRFADSVDELWDGGKGMSYGQALIAARRQLPDIVPQIPAGASNADKRDWFTKNVPAGTLYRNARGDLTVWPGMPSDQPQVPRD
jgi:soluble lytic murein transglycosylase-like protein